MKTFLGKIEAKIDVKGRVFVPSVFRKVFSEEDRERVVVRMEADEKYLVVYPESVWNKQVLDLQSKLNEWDPEDQMLLMQFVGQKCLAFEKLHMLTPHLFLRRLCNLKNKWK